MNDHGRRSLHLVFGIAKSRMADAAAQRGGRWITTQHVECSPKGS
jgi:hypothetical protein